MAHSHQASRNARQKLFAVSSFFGVPALMWTLNFEDGFNFRIRIYSNQFKKDDQQPPYYLADSDTICDFVASCNCIRTECPGLCAWDFKQLLTIAIEHLIGWDIKEQTNKPNYGLFGDVDAFSHSDEEQARNTLHTRMVLWIKHWSPLMNV